MLTGLMFCALVGVKASPGLEGKTIFTERCMVCHKIGTDFTGPELSGVEKRHTIDWIVKFVHGSQNVIKSGDTSAIALFQKFNAVVMPDQADLTEAEIKSIIEYINGESKKLAAEQQAAFKASTLEAANAEVTSNKGFIISFVIVTIMLILVLLFAANVKRLERKMHGK